MNLKSIGKKNKENATPWRGPQRQVCAQQTSESHELKYALKETITYRSSAFSGWAEENSSMQTSEMVAAKPAMRNPFVNGLPGFIISCTPLKAWSS